MVSVKANPQRIDVKVLEWSNEKEKIVCGRNVNIILVSVVYLINKHNSKKDNLTDLVLKKARALK